MTLNAGATFDPRVTVFPDHAALAAAAADHFIEIVASALQARGSATVALAGGQTPRAMNALLTQPPRRSQIDWTKVRFYFGDERCVPPEHADSNYRMTRETLFDPLAIAADRVFRLRGEDEPQAAALAYERLLQETLAGLPLDLALLGMGPDGHTASLFPGTIAGIDEHRWAVANFVPKFNTYRLTLTPRVFNAAANVTITAANAEKADALRAVLTGPSEPDRYPAQLINPKSGNLRWLVDAAAAAQLAAPTA